MSINALSKLHLSARSESLVFLFLYFGVIIFSVLTINEKVMNPQGVVPQASSFTVLFQPY